MIFSTNPYRVLGVSSDSGIKDVKKNISKLKAFAKIGKEMELDYNLSFLNLAKLARTDDLLLKSENQLNLDKNKITNSIFWFADLSPIDAVALAHLIKGDISKTIEIWDKATTSKEVSLKNYSAFNNLSTLLLLNTLDDSKTDTFKKDNDSIKQIKKAIKLKNEFISSTSFNNYCESISKSTPISSDDAQEFFTNTILDLFNKNFSTKELSDLFEDLDDKLKEKLSDTLTEAPLSNVKSHIDSANELIKSDEKSGSKVGKKLIKDTRKDFTHLKDVLGVDDFQFQTLSDQLSNQILQCGIVCFNSTGDDQEYLSSYKYALSIALDDKTKNRAKDSIKHCEEVKNAHLCQFCDTGRSANVNIKINMHKMTGFSEYTYFKDGGLKVSSCIQCLAPRILLKLLLFLLGAIAWPILAFLIIIIRQYKESWFSWFYRLLYRNIFGLTVKNHPMVQKYINEGYRIGMP